MKIMLWNVNCTAGELNPDSIKDSIKIKKIMNKINDKNPDLLILTEFREHDGKKDGKKDVLVKELKEYGYEVNTSVLMKLKNRENQVLIAIRSAVADNIKDIEVRDITPEDYIGKKCENTEKEKPVNLKVKTIERLPNFLEVRFKQKGTGKQISVVGCRMITGGKDVKGQKNYDMEAVQFYDVLMPEIHRISEEMGEDGMIIVGGDFNNAKIYQEPKEKYNEKSYTGKYQINHNLNRIWEKFNEYGFTQVDNWDVTFWHRSGKINGSLDHLFIKCAEEIKGNVEVEQCDENLFDHAIVIFDTDGTNNILPPQ